MPIYGLKELYEAASKTERDSSSNAYFCMLLTIFSVPLFLFFVLLVSSATSVTVSSDQDYFFVACFICLIWWEYICHLQSTYLFDLTWGHCFKVITNIGVYIRSLPDFVISFFCG